MRDNGKHKAKKYDRQARVSFHFVLPKLFA
jgi:hypothetical protein